MSSGNNNLFQPQQAELQERAERYHRTARYKYRSKGLLTPVFLLRKKVIEVPKKNFALNNNILPTSLYIHVPFCVRKCLYCDFVSYPYTERDARSYLAALSREIQLRVNSLSDQRWALSTVFIGGGTPTCLSTDMLLEIINLIKKHFKLAHDLEFTIEANPGTLNLSKLTVLRRAGVNRLSLGAQSCHEQTLRTLGRIHSHRQTEEAVQWAREAGFNNINLDLIFEVPGQTIKEWRQCLDYIVLMHPEHVSAYGLQVEEGTPFQALVDSGQLVLCDDDTRLAMYYDAINILCDAGLYQYEISNFARQGAQCRHNLAYWHNQPYLGLGPSAHSRIQHMRTANTGDLGKYYGMLVEGVLPINRSERLTWKNDIFETIFLALRLNAGLDLKEFEKRYGLSLEEVYPGVAQQMIKKGLLEIANGRLRLTAQGLVVANTVMAEFVPS